MLSQTQKEALITAAILAPSADNSQPELFSWHNDNTLDVWIDESRSGKSSDNRFVLSDIAIGCVIENVAVKAASLQLQANIEFFPYGQQQAYFVARITFSDIEKAQHGDLAQAIPNRCTDRRFPFKGPIEQSTYDYLNEQTSKDTNVIKWFKNKAEIKKVLPIIQQAESIRFKSQQLHEELFSTVKFNQPDADEGMPLEVLAIEKPAQPFFKLMKKWSVMRVFNWFGAYAMLGIRSVKLPILFSPALALVTIESDDRLNVIKGGRRLQRFWLAATVKGLAVQPYAAPGIFSLRFVASEPEFTKEIHQVADSMDNLIANGHGLIFLRVGKTSPVAHRTNRRNWQTFFRSTED